MNYNFKDIHIGHLIYTCIIEKKIETSRICNFLKVSEEEVNSMYKAKSLDSEILLKWSKLLEYDFFRIYTQHLILYAPPSKKEIAEENQIKMTLPQFKKNIYTKEIIDFIISLVDSGEMDKKQVIDTYKIPKTTLYKWIEKYSRDDK